MLNFSVERMAADGACLQIVRLRPAAIAHPIVRRPNSACSETSL
jgi:hypothetical protein